MTTEFVGIKAIEGWHVQEYSKNVQQGGMDRYVFISYYDEVVVAACNNKIYFQIAVESLPAWAKAIIDHFDA